LPRSKCPPPADFDEYAKTLWRKTQKQLEEQSTWQESDMAALERYVRAQSKARLAWSGIPRKKDGSLDLTARGSQGQLVQHPNVKTARESERDAQDYARDLLLTPKAREQHQIEKHRAQKGGKFALD
jgi:P27 family predicted phage terminase small subunit